MRHLLEGFISAPLTAGVVGGIVVSIWTRSDAGVIVALGGMASGYVAILLFGGPLFFVWKRRGWFSASAIVALGVISALLMTFLLSLLVRGGRDNTPWLVGLVSLLSFSLPIGFLGGLSLWWFGIRGNTAPTGPAKGTSGSHSDL